MSRTDIPGTLSRRSLLQASAGLAGGALLPSAFSIPAFAVGEQSPIGTWPDGSKGNSVTVSIAVPRTGTYAVQGEDELKGWQLAVEHINSGHLESGLRDFRVKLLGELRWRYRELRNLCAQFRFPPQDPKVYLSWRLRLEEYKSYIEALTGKTVVSLEDMSWNDMEELE